jgi:hypothetical protein
MQLLMQRDFYGSVNPTTQVTFYGIHIRLLLKWPIFQLLFEKVYLINVKAVGRSTIFPTM